MAAGFPAPSLRDGADRRRHPGDRLAARTRPTTSFPTGLREGTLHSWNVAFQRQLPFQLTADIAYVGNRGVDLVMDVDENASLVYGSGNVGRPQFARLQSHRHDARPHATRTSPSTTRCR